ncbi:HpcH/HpaI aldolase/citrate lyase family protein [Brevibacterium litoralis]|uniref:HpcH/HpaI aldolase/citrate lyase family protein n=1 Tax=Brevibacterium litoralis TaxID=3138935 RepID=UPI0032ED891B
MTAWTPGPGWLFCPADRPERYPKALAAADVVILDLEDAVAPENKESAREALRGLVADGTFETDRTVVRISGVNDPEHAADLALLQELAFPRVMLAKSETVDELRGLGEAAPETQVVVLVESPLGVDNVSALSAEPNVVAVMWGADDLVAGLGGTSSRKADGTYRDVALHARHRSLLGAKAAGRLALDAVHMDIPDLEGLAAECEDAVAIGFDATVAIHPKQVAVIRDSYSPAPSTADWARRLLDHVGDDRGVTTFEGRMVDGPIYKQAERILRLAEATGTGATGTAADSTSTTNARGER